MAFMEESCKLFKKDLGKQLNYQEKRSCKCLFTIECSVDVSADKYKARLVAEEFYTNLWRINCQERELSKLHLKIT